MVHAAQASDVPEVVALVRSVLAEFGLTFGVGAETDTQLLGLPASYAGGAFFVAREDVLVGCAGMFPVDAGVLELRKMYVAPAARGHGIGKQLWAACLTFARSRDARHIVLDTTDQMTAAISFYERAGFVRDDAQVRGARCHRGYRLDL